MMQNTQKSEEQRTFKLKYIVEQFLILMHKQKQKHQHITFFQTMMFIFHHLQIVSYITRVEEQGVIYESFLLYVISVLKLTTGGYYLKLVKNDSLILVLISILFVFNVSVFVYLFFKSYLIKIKEVRQGSLNYYIFHTVDSGFYNYILCFQHIFFIPQIELFSCIFFCNQKSFLQINKDGCVYNGNSEFIYTFFKVIAFLGSLVVIMLSSLISYYNTNHEFQDRNILNRKFSYMQIILNLNKILIIIIYMAEIGQETNYLIKYLVANTFSILMAFDFIRYQPYRDKTIQQMHGMISFNIILVCIVFTCWESFRVLETYNIIYIIFIMQPMVMLGTKITIDNFTNELLNSTVKDICDQQNMFISHFLEELSYLSENSEKNHQHKIRLISFIRNHLQTCIDPDCNFKKGTEFDNYLVNNDINQHIIFRIIQVIYYMYLKSKMNKSNSQNDYQLLKYCNLLTQKQENKVRAYFELQKIRKFHRRNLKLFNVQNNQVYFKTLFKIQINIIQEDINNMFKNMEKAWGSNQKQFKKVYMYSQTLSQYENIKKQLLSKIIKISQLKQTYWENMVEGFNLMDQQKVMVLEISEQITKFKETFEDFLSTFQHVFTNENIIIMKYQAITGALVYNDSDYCEFYENIIEDLKKKEWVNFKDTINSINIMKGNSILITTSVLNFNSTIINQLNIKHAKFFNYTEEEIVMINKLETFMPWVYQNNHKQFIVDFLRQPSKLSFKINRRLFAQTRENFIFPVYIFLDFCNEFRQDFCINAILTKYNQYNKSLIFNSKGQLSGLEKETFNILLRSQNIRKEKKDSKNRTQKEKEQPNINLTSILYTSMNLIFLFPKLYQKMIQPDKKNNYQGDKLKISTSKEILKNIDTYLYFPKNFFQFTDLFLKNCQSFKPYQEDNYQTMQKSWSKTKFSTNSLNTNDSDIDQKNENLSKSGFLEDHPNKLLVKQSKILKLDINYQQDREFVLDFLKRYHKQYPDSFEVYDCNVNILQNHLPIKSQSGQFFVVEINSISRKIAGEQSDETLIDIMRDDTIQQIEAYESSSLEQSIRKPEQKIKQAQQENLQLQSVSLSSISYETDVPQVSKQDQSKQINFLSRNQKMDSVEQKINKDIKRQLDSKNIVIESEGDYSINNSGEDDNCLQKKKLQNFSQHEEKESDEWTDVQSLNKDKDRSKQKKKQKISTNSDFKNEKQDKSQQDPHTQKKNYGPKFDQNSKLDTMNYKDQTKEKLYRQSIDNSNNDSQKRFSLKNDDDRNSVQGIGKGEVNKKGLRLLKRLVETKKRTKILKVGVVMFLIQSSFFILCDMIIYYLIANQVQTFMRKLDLMNGLDEGIGTLQKGFMLFNYRYIIDRGLISKPSSVGIDYQKQIIKQASDKQKQLQKDNIEYVRFLNSIKVQKYIVRIKDINQNTGKKQYELELTSVNMFNIFKQYIIMYERFLRNADYFNNDGYFDLRINYQIYYQQIEQILQGYIKELNDGEEYFHTFYISIGIMALVMTNLIQLLYLPYYSYYYQFQERILFIISRVSVLEGNLEVQYYKMNVKILQNTSDNYLLKTFQQDENNQYDFQQDISSKNAFFVEHKTQSNNKNLINKINYQKLKRTKFLLLSIGASVLLIIYFMIYFIIFPSVKNKMTYVNYLKEQESKMKSKLQNVKIFENVLIYMPYTEAKDYATAAIIEGYKFSYRNSLNLLKQITSQDSTNIFMSSMQTEQQMFNMETILKKKEVCNLVKQFDDCGKDFERGLIGYLNLVIANSYQYEPYILGNERLTLEQIKIMNPQATVDDQIRSELVIQSILSILKEETIKVIDTLLLEIQNTYSFLCFLAGFFIYLIMVLILMRLYMILNQETLYIISGLQLIPLKKLQDQSTITYLTRLTQSI